MIEKLNWNWWSDCWKPSAAFAGRLDITKQSEIRNYLCELERWLLGDNPQGYLYNWKKKIQWSIFLKDSKKGFISKDDQIET